MSEHLPIVVSNEIQSLEKTKDVEALFIAIGVQDDVERADRRKVRAGRGKMRGRKHKKGKGPLIVVAEDNGIGYAARNLPGVEISSVAGLNAELLAPGAHPGRLVIWTESAFSQIDEVWME
jgi:large subunit ribosomal protein L4e